MNVILFCFAGRRANLELQLPFIRRILDDHPNVRYDVWDLSRDNTDSRYLQTIEGDRITVHTQYRQFSPGYTQVWKHYADPQYQDCLFVKLDDDVVFLETQRFAAFTEAIIAHRTAVLSANVINNGACTPLQSGLWEKFQETAIPLLDIHTSAPYAAMAHNHFFNHHTDIIGEPLELVPTEDWLSINAIGYDWTMGCRIANKVGSQLDGPVTVAGRPLLFLGDEGAVNTLPRIIMRGFCAGHLTFGPQKLTEPQLGPWRARYADIGHRYLTGRTHLEDRLPALSATSRGQPCFRTEHLNQWTDPSNGNNPTVGRFTP